MLARWRLNDVMIIHTWSMINEYMFRCISDASFMLTHYCLFIYTTSTTIYVHVAYFGERHFIYISIFVFYHGMHNFATRIITSIMHGAYFIRSIAFHIFIGLCMTKIEHVYWATMQHVPKWYSFFIFNSGANTNQYECMAWFFLFEACICVPLVTCMNSIFTYLLKRNYYHMLMKPIIWWRFTRNSLYNLFGPVRDR
jgi:hypothetical protein